jgi:Berberine and berberine like
MAAMKPHAGKTEYVNYLSSDEPDRVRAAYGLHHRRLAQLKRRHDPQNIFRGNRNIAPV